MDRNLLSGGLGLIVLLVAVIIGAAMVDKSIVIADNITDGADTVSTAVAGNVQTSMTTFTGLLPLAVLALVGGVAILKIKNYIISYLDNTSLDSHLGQQAVCNKYQFLSRMRVIARWRDTLPPAAF